VGARGKWQVVFKQGVCTASLAIHTDTGREGCSGKSRAGPAKRQGRDSSTARRASGTSRATACIGASAHRRDTLTPGRPPRRTGPCASRGIKGTFPLPRSLCVTWTGGAQTHATMPRPPPVTGASGRPVAPARVMEPKWSSQALGGLEGREHAAQAPPASLLVICNGPCGVCAALWRKPARP